MLHFFKMTFVGLFSLLFLQGMAQSLPNDKTKQPIPAANQPDLYLPLLKGKKVGIVANQTSIVQHISGTKHLVDFLLNEKISIEKIFVPEHGFRGTADAGENIAHSHDPSTRLPLISLYGKNKKPSSEQLKGIDCLLFDMQDVGVRFYTYISTLHYVMEAAAEQKIPVIVLDRPNPNGFYIDGPLLEVKQKSFVGMHPVPIVYGMTIGEYAQMINGEKWLAKGVKCKLTIIPLAHYTHQTRYTLPVKPSPNLPNATAINLYPSLCFFEGTNVSVGRGTEHQFQCYGAPFLDKSAYEYTFTPQPNVGAKQPPHNGVRCYGENLTQHPELNQLSLQWLIKAYKNNTDKAPFFNNFFNKLAGNTLLQEQIKQGLSEAEIRKSWQNDLTKFKKIREKYLLYK